MKSKFNVSLVAASLLLTFQASAIEIESAEKNTDVTFKAAIEHLDFQKNLSADFSANVATDASKSTVAQERNWQGNVVTAPVLTILVEFPDALHNSIKPAVTGHYFDDYSVEHYRKVVHAKGGYTGPAPDLATLPSMRDYLLDQSGGSFDIKGDIFGWYTAENNFKFYGEATQFSKDVNASALVIEAVESVLGDPAFNLADYDANNDGVIDHLSIIHATLGQESGSSPDYIWSHRSTINAAVTNADTNLSATIGSYIIQPISAAAGVLAHEFGHDLGLPDEYDVHSTSDQYSKPGSTVGNWSMMASGSWVGKIAGTNPSGYSPFAKLMLQNKYGGNWVQSSEINANELTASGTTLKLHQAATKGQFNDLVKVNLPEQTVQNFTPLNKQAYTAGSNSFGYMTNAISLTRSANPKVTLDVNMAKAMRNGWGFRIGVFDYTVGQTVFIAPEQNDNISVFGEKITDTNSTWQKVTYDLSAFKNSPAVTFIFQNYSLNTARGHVAFDNVQLEDGDVAFPLVTSENDNNLTNIRSTELSDGTIKFSPYYLLEWRQHAGVDAGLSAEGYEEGLLVWYADPSYMANFGDIPTVDNGTGNHPGEGWLGVVDADRNPITVTTSNYDKNGQWLGDSRNDPLSSNFQIKDAPFNNLVQKGSVNTRRRDNADGSFSITNWSDYFITGNPKFIDWDDYSNYIRPATGWKLPKHGIIIDVVEQSEDQSTATIKVSKVW